MAALLRASHHNDGKQGKQRHQREQGKEYNTTRRVVVVPHGSNALGGPLGPYRSVLGTPRTVPRTASPCHACGQRGAAGRNSALGSGRLEAAGEAVTEQRSCSSVPVSSVSLDR